MGTPNFARPKNTTTYYVVTPEEQWEIEYLKEGIAEDLDYDLMAEKNDWDRGYPTISYANKSILLSHNLYIALDFELQITSGYYEGATLDYEAYLCLGTGYGFEVNQYSEDQLKAFIREDIEYAELELSDSEVDSEVESIYEWIANTLDSEGQRIEETFARFSQHKLECQGVFSNGEAVYIEKD